MLAAAWLTAGFTGVLAIFAIVTAVFAIRAFRKQSQEVADQASLLEIQSGQLDAQREQLAGQQAFSKQQTQVLELQAQELTESLTERKREADERHRGQAAQVAAWFGHSTSSSPFPNGPRINMWGATVRNESGLPIYDVRVTFHLTAAGDGLSSTLQPARRVTDAEPIRVIAPRSQQFTLPPEQASTTAGNRDESTSVSVEFTDAAGNRWERDPRGALRALDPGDSPPD